MLSGINFQFSFFNIFEKCYFNCSTANIWIYSLAAFRELDKKFIRFHGRLMLQYFAFESYYDYNYYYCYNELFLCKFITEKNGWEMKELCAVLIMLKCMLIQFILTNARETAKFIHEKNLIIIPFAVFHSTFYCAQFLPYWKHRCTFSLNNASEENFPFVIFNEI